MGDAGAAAIPQEQNCHISAFPLATTGTLLLTEHLSWQLGVGEGLLSGTPG